MVLLLRTVLTLEEQQLLTVFAAITEPRVRQALLDVAAAATNMPAATTSDLSTNSAIDDVSVRRVRRALLWQCSGKPGDYL